MKTTVPTMSFEEFGRNLETSLARLDQFDIDWRRTRFGQYARSWAEAVRMIPLRHGSPREQDRVTTWQRDSDKQALVLEAASQGSQFINATTIWPFIEPVALAHKLTRIVKGDALPADDGRPDDPRNVLSELTTAALLYNRNIDVKLTDDKTDIEASIPGFAPFAIECKRPMRVDTIDTNLRLIRTQLGTRYETGFRHGIGILAVDRSADFSHGKATPNLDTLERGVGRLLESVTRDIRKRVQRDDLRYFPATPLVGVLLSCTVYVQGNGFPVSVNQLAVACTADNDSQARQLVETVSGVLRRPARPLGVGHVGTIGLPPSFVVDRVASP